MKLILLLTGCLVVILAEAQEIKSSLRDTLKVDEVVVTGTMKEISRDASPVPIEIYTPKFFEKNKAPNLFENMSLVNGVQPQLNCNVCNTGDIHINGMEGPYTQVLIDGMASVSGLSSVYGLMGIPNAMIERVEVVKGPAATLYGSESIGGLINVITKSVATAPLLSLDVYGSSVEEFNVDASTKWQTGKLMSLTGMNYFKYHNPIDINKDNFTDVTQQHRVSLFNKLDLKRNENRTASLSLRYYYEDRWGGELQWKPELRGSDSLYGESIYTNRYEVFGKYQLPAKEKIFVDYSYNYHDQNSWYGDMPYMAVQQVGLVQAFWDKKINDSHDALLGIATRYTHYDDNTPATAGASQTWLPGIFIQDEYAFHGKHRLLLGMRYDYNSLHGNILTPRLNWKYNYDERKIFRLSFGTGYRVVNVFTEDHAALTGSREVVFIENLKPEKSYNVNLNYVHKLYFKYNSLVLDASVFYTHFTNQIIADYLTNNEQIIYGNLHGYSVSRGFSLNTDYHHHRFVSLNAGITILDVFKNENEVKQHLLFAPKFSGTLAASFPVKWNITLDWTSLVKSPMHLPVVADDYRPGRSPWFALQNLQAVKKFNKSWEVYVACKNIFDFYPREDVLLRAHDPFNKNIYTDNPYLYTFDTTYNYAPIQGRKWIAGIRWKLIKDKI